MNRLDWTDLSENPTSFAAMQGNIPQQIKWDPEFLKDQIVTYLGMTEDHWDTDLILWPETAIPIPQDQAGKIIDHISAELGENSTLITGIPWYGFSDRIEDFTFHNSIMAIGNGEGMYHKQKLVPFGEYVPLQSVLRGLIGFFDLPMSDFSRGPEWQEPLEANGINVMPFICYEVAIPILSPLTPGAQAFCSPSATTAGSATLSALCSIYKSRGCGHWKPAATCFEAPTMA